MTTQQQIAQAVMQELSDSLNVRTLTANPEHEPSSTCDYYMFADTFTYQGMHCRAVVTIYISGKIDAGLYAKSQCDSRPEGFRWGISRATVAEAVAEFPKVIHQATHTTMENEQYSQMSSRVLNGMGGMGSFKRDYIRKHQPLAPKDTYRMGTDYATLEMRIAAWLVDTLTDDTTKQD